MCNIIDNRTCHLQTIMIQLSLAATSLRQDWWKLMNNHCQIHKHRHANTLQFIWVSMHQFICYVSLFSRVHWLAAGFILVIFLYKCKNKIVLQQLWYYLWRNFWISLWNLWGSDSDFTGNYCIITNPQHDPIQTQTDSTLTVLMLFYHPLGILKTDSRLLVVQTCSPTLRQPFQRSSSL